MTISTLKSSLNQVYTGFKLLILMALCSPVFTQAQTCVADQTVTLTPSSANGACASSTVVSTSSSETGVKYYLKDKTSGVQLSGPVDGTGSAISFPTQNVSKTSTYLVVGRKTGTTGYLDFDGIDDNVVTAPINLANASFTIEFWAKRHVVDGSAQCMFSLGASANSQGLHFLWQNSSEIKLGFYADDMTIGNLATTTDWQHYAITFNASTKVRKVYIDGVLVGQGTAGANFLGNGAAYIGRMFPGFNYYWNGGIDDVRIWNTDFSETQVQSEMYTGSLTGSESNLLAYYDFNEGAGTVLTDKTGHGYTGTLTNMDPPNDWLSRTVVLCAQEMATMPTFTLSPVVDQTVTTNVLSSSTCSTTSQVSLGGSETGVDYFLRNQATDALIAGPVAGTGSAISFPQQTAYANTTYKISGSRSNGVNVATVLDFDGVNDQVVVPQTASLNLTNAFTVEAWVYLRSYANSYPALFSINDDNGIVLWLESGGTCVRVAGSQIAGSVVSLNAWHHIAVTFSGGQIKMYADGAQIATGTAGNPILGTAPLKIGNWNGYTRNLDGQISNMSIWNIARSAAEIGSDMSSCVTGLESGLVAAYNFSDGSGTTLTDKSVYLNNGQLTNMDPANDWTTSASLTTVCSACTGSLSSQPSVTVAGPADQPVSLSVLSNSLCSTTSQVNLSTSESGVNYFLRNANSGAILAGPVAGTGGAISFTPQTTNIATSYKITATTLSGNGVAKVLDFDGVNDRVVVPRSNSMNFTTAFTFEAWVYTRAYTPYCGIFAINDGAGVALQVYNGGTNLRMNGANLLGPVVSLNAWSHFAVSYDSGIATLYVNGVQAAQQNVGAITLASAPLILGNWNDGSEMLNGQMTNVSLWNTTRSASQILADMSSCLSGNESGLVAAYNFADGSGNILSDLSPNANHGTLVNMDPATDWTINTSLTSSCATCSRTLSTTPTVTVTLPDDQTVGISTATLCGTGSATINLGSSQTGFNYSLLDNADNTLISGPVAGTGSALSINTGYVSANKTFKVHTQTASGYSLNFLGNGYVNMGNSINPVLAGTSAISVEAWVYLTSYTNQYQTIAGNWDQVKMQFLLRADEFGYAAFWINNGSNHDRAMDGKRIPLNTWTHLAGTWDGTTSKLYVNGVLVATNSRVGQFPSTTGPLIVGRSATTEFFAGNITDVRIWSVARTLTQVNTGMNGCLGAGESGLLAWYKMTEGPGSATLNDMSGHGYTGTLTSMDVNTSWKSGVGMPNCCSAIMASRPTLTVITDQVVGAAKSSVCGVGNSTTINIQSSQTGVNYTLRNDADNTVIDGPKAGTGSALTFATGPVNTATTFHIYAAAADGSCSLICSNRPTVFTNTISDQVVSADVTSGTCNAPVVVSVAGTQTGVLYSLYDNSTSALLAGPISGTGAAASFPVQSITTTKTLNVTASGGLLSNNLMFPTSAGYVNIPDNGTLDLSQTYTIEAWVYPADNANNTIIDKGTDRYLFQTHPNGNQGLGLYLNGTWYYSTGSVPVNVWSHVAVTLDKANDEIKFYMNGVLLNTFNGVIDLAPDNGPINIGRQNPTSCSCNPFNGKMADLRVWTKVRSLTEIATNKDHALTGSESGLAAYYRFDHGSGTTLSDKTANGNNGTLTGSLNTSSWENNFPVFGQPGCPPLVLTNKPVISVTAITTPTLNSSPTSQAAGACALVLSTTSSQSGINYYLRNNTSGNVLAGPIPGTGSGLTFPTQAINATTTFAAYGSITNAYLNFDGTDDYVSGGTALNLVNSSFSVEFWAKRTVNGNDQHLISLGTAAANNGLDIRWQNGSTLVFSFYNNDLVVTGLTTTNVWQHYAFTYDAASKARKIYLDGVLVGSDVASADFTGTGAFRVARGLGAVTDNFPGGIDEVRVWNIVRSASQINSNMNVQLVGTESNLQAYYNFNESSGTVALDVSGKGNTGTLTNMTVPAAWKARSGGSTCGVTGTRSVSYTASGAFASVTSLPVCAGSAVTLRVTSGTTAGTYQLRKDGTTNVGAPIAGSATVTFPTQTVNATTVFNVLYTRTSAPAGCSFQLPVTVTVGAAEAATPTVIPAVATICSGGSTNIVITNSITGYTYQLRNDADNSNVGSAVAGNTAAAINLTTGALSATKTFNVLVTKSGCTNVQLTQKATVTVVSALSDQTVTAAATTVPLGTGTNITLASSELGVSYTLRNDADNTVVSGPKVGTGGPLVFSTDLPTANKTYNVLASSAGGCSSLTLSTKPTITVTGGQATITDQTVTAGTTSICASGSTTIALGGSQTGVNYSLRNDANNTIVAGPTAGTGSAISFNTGTITSTKTYNVYADNGSTTLQLTTKPTVNVYSLPTVTANASASMVCFNEPLTLTGGGASSYTWNYGVSNGVPFQPDTAATYVVTGKDAHNCTNTAQVRVLVNNDPPKALCKNISAYVNGSGSVSITPAQVDNLSGSTCSSVSLSFANSATSKSYSCNNLGQQSITLYVKDGNDSTSTCSSTVTVIDTVRPVPNVSSLAARSEECYAVLTAPTATDNCSGTLTATTTDPTTYTSTGTYTVHWTYTDASGNTSTQNQMVTIYGSQPVTMSYINPMCANANVLPLTQGSPAGGSYTIDGVPATEFNPAALGAGSHVVKYAFETNAGCMVYAEQNVVVKAVTTPTLPNFAAICLNNGLLTLTGGTPTGGTYSGTGVSAGKFNPAVTGVGTSSISYQITNASGCKGITTATIEVKALPDVNINQLDAVCLQGDPVDLQAETGTTGTFTGPGVNNNIFSPSVAGAGTHELTYTYSANGCTNSTIRTIQVISNPTVTMSDPGSICANGALFAPTVSPIGGTLSGEGVEDGEFNPNLTPGNYDLTYTYTSDGCSASVTKTITVKAVPTPTITAGKTNLCQGESSMLFTGAFDSYQWYNEGNAIVGATSASLNVNEEGNYTVEVINVGCTNKSDGVSVTVSALPTPQITTAGSPSFCVSSAITLQTGSYQSYQWYLDQQPIAGSTAATCLANVSGSYSVMVNDGNCRGLSAPVVINGSSPVAVSADKEPKLCQGTEITLSSSNATSYQWRRNGVDIPMATQKTYKTTVAGLYSVFVTDGSGCTATSGELEVIVNENPTPTLNVPGVTEFCEGESTNLSTQTFASYRWKRDGIIIPGANFNTFTVNSSGSYSVMVTDENGCRANTESTNITVNPIPSALLTPSGVVNKCEGEELEISVVEPAGQYVWFNGSTIIAGAENQQLMVTTSGSYKAKVISSEGCENTSAATIAFFKNAPNQPQITFDGTSLTSTSGPSYQWYRNGELIVDANGQKLDLNSNGNYTVVITGNNGCSTSSEVFEVNNLGVENAIVTEGISVFPNPFGESLNVNLPEGANYQLLDVNGKQIATGSFVKGTNQLSTDHLARGVYHLSLITQGKQQVIKLVK